MIIGSLLDSYLQIMHEFDIKNSQNILCGYDKNWVPYFGYPGE